jgi:hypothetical protein
LALHFTGHGFEKKPFNSLLLEKEDGEGIEIDEK